MIVYNVRRRHLKGNLQFCVKKSSCWRDLWLVVDIIMHPPNWAPPPILHCKGCTFIPSHACQQELIGTYEVQNSYAAMPGPHFQPVAHLLIMWEKLAIPVEHHSDLHMYKYEWTTLTSHHSDDTIFTYVLGSKLPIFPYNRGWSSTQ